MIRNLLHPLAAATALVATASVAHAQEPYVEEGGLVVMQCENLNYPDGWTLRTNDGAGYTGEGYLEYTGPDSFGSGGRSVIAIKVLVSTPGNYQIRIRNRHDHPDHTEGNDLFWRTDFHEWDKIYSSQDGHHRFGWQTQNEEAGHTALQAYLSAGEHTFEISGRSRGMKIDRIHIFLDSVSDPLNLGYVDSPQGSAIPVALNWNFGTSDYGFGYSGQVGPFTPPIASSQGGRLSLTAPDNMSFGFWKSQTTTLGDDVSHPGKPRVIEIRSKVSGSVTPVLSPTIRFRASRPDFSHTSEYVISSYGSGQASPSAQGKNYSQFIATGNNTALDYYFDVMNFEAGDASDSTLSLEQVQMFNREDVEESNAGISVLLNFATGTAGFSFNQVIGQPNLFPTPLGLAMNGAGRDPNSTLFGFWTAEAGVKMESGVVYEVQARISSDAATREQNPTIRVRVNDSSYQMGVLDVYEPVGTAFGPLANFPETYRMFFKPDAAVVGNNFVFSVDYLYVPGSSTNLNTTITVESLAVIAHR